MQRLPLVPPPPPPPPLLPPLRNLTGIQIIKVFCKWALSEKIMQTLYPPPPQQNILHDNLQ